MSWILFFSFENEYPYHLKHVCKGINGLTPYDFVPCSSDVMHKI